MGLSYWLELWCWPWTGLHRARFVVLWVFLVGLWVFLVVLLASSLQVCQAVRLVSGSLTDWWYFLHCAQIRREQCQHTHRSFGVSA